MSATPVPVDPITQPADLQAALEVVRNNHSFLIVGHLRPDGDCFGSCLGLLQGLLDMGKKARFYTFGPVPSYFGYLPNFDKIETAYPEEKFDAILCVDTSDAERVHQGYQPEGLVAVIDHHVSNTRFGTVNWVESKLAAAAEMVYFFLQELGVTITPEIATCLYTGIMTDTGGFRFGNTNQTTFRVASDLVMHGAQPAKIAEAVFDSRTPATVKIGALVLSSLKYEFDGRLCWNEITQAMMRSTGDTEAEPEGLSSEMRAIQGVDVAILFYETPEGHCRIGFRSRGDANVSDLAALLGGGGHKNASGAYIPRPYPETRDHAIGVIREYLGKHFS